jgi:hypothetical protein
MIDSWTKSRLLLQLPEDFDHDALDVAYRGTAAALRGIPADKQEATLRALNEARDYLRSSLGPRPGKELARRTVVGVKRMPVLPSAELERRIEASEQSVKAAVTQSIGRLAAVKQQRFTVGLLLAGLAVAGGLIRVTGTFSPEEGTVTLREALAWGSGISAFLGAFSGALGWAVKGREQWLKLQIEGVAGALTDRATLADTLDEIDVESPWTRQEFRAAIESWISRQRTLLGESKANVGPDVFGAYARVFRAIGILAPKELDEEIWRVASKIGPTDFAGIVLSKGAETGIVEEAIVRDGDGQERHGYRRVVAVL